MSFVRTVSLLALTTNLLLVGCSDSESSPTSAPLKELGIDDGASKGASISKLARSTEETTLKLSTGARVVIPEGALDKETEIGLKRPEDKTALALVKTLPDDHKVASAPYVLTPHGSKFKQDVELTLPIAKTNSQHLAVAWLEDEKDTTWEVYDAPPAVAGKEASIKIAHFSVLVLLERDAPSAVDGAADELDAGVSTEVPDASSVEDAALNALDASGGALDAMVDANVPDAELTSSQQLTARFAQCGTQSHTGDFNDGLILDTVYERCLLSCALSASCADFESEWCPFSESSLDYIHCKDACTGLRYITCTNTTTGGQIEATVCNGTTECSGGQDESSCQNAFFTCAIREQIRVEQVCDGTSQCSNGLDESNCPGVTYFTCANGQRVRSEWRCDGQRNCGDGSDEVACPSFPCTNGSTIPLNKVCDVEWDCADGSDEPARCLHLTCVDQAHSVD